MGMVIDGTWTDEDRFVERGIFVREPSVFGSEVPHDLIDAMSAEPGRFHLIASLSCPWSHRALIVRALKRLEAFVPVQLAHGLRVQGYAINGSVPWTVPGTGEAIRHLHELYTLSDPAYTGRSTVPVLWDSTSKRIVSNSSLGIMRAFDAVATIDGHPDFTLRPEALAEEIDMLGARIYDQLSNGVYRAGFAEQQRAYDTAVHGVFTMLDELEMRLTGQRHLFGPAVTEVDWQLLPTLLRFDAIYHVLHKCCRRRLIDYPSLWAYGRDLYQWNGVSGTVDFAAMRAGSYENDTTGNPHRIVAVCPDADWTAPHNRTALGPAQITLRSGSRVEVDPATLKLLKRH